MKYETTKKTFACCGQYVVPTNAVKDKQIKCPRCGSILKEPIDCPHVVIVKSS